MCPTSYRPITPQNSSSFFESPHVEELKARLPVVGSAGRSALRFLCPGDSRSLGLGQYVRQRHAAGDSRIAVLNVSNVPMQAAAFVEVEGPDLQGGEWTLIEKVRRSRARSIRGMRGAETQRIAQVLVDGLRERLADVVSGTNGQVVGAGTFAQRMVSAAIPELTPHPLQVPHPSFNQWNWRGNKDLPDLIDLRDRFGGHRQANAGGVVSRHSPGR